MQQFIRERLKELRLLTNIRNLQQIPSTSTHAKIIKKCFKAHEKWLLVGADFTALESKIDTLLTKDPMKEVVYTDGFDSHCLASYFYFKDQMPDITKELDGYFDTKNLSKEEAVKVINSIKHRYPALRQDSKAVSFAILYGGTHHTLKANCGLTEEIAKEVEANYHKLYKVSGAWKEARLKQATKDGYTTVAFGLRVRAPLLKQVVWDSSSIPHEASAEGRTLGNAMGQSYCMLNNRATNAFMDKVWNSKYRLSILPIAQIHDASYYLIRDNPEVIKFTNDNLIKEMQWQELPEIYHPTVRLGAELDVFKEGWHKPITLPNGASIELINDLLKDT